jgi:hypothetical protein
MRWSLILSTFFVVQSVLSFVCVALAIPPSLDELERRAQGLSWSKVSSKAYRTNSKSHHYAYTFHQTGDVTRSKLKHPARLRHGEKAIKFPHVDADHVFEHQMLQKELQYHGLAAHDLAEGLQKKVKSIMNDPRNMVPVPRGANRSKGVLMKHAMNGKAIKPNRSRDQYVLVSYSTAKATARKLDSEFLRYGHTNIKFKDRLRQAMEHANILQPGQSSPPSSSP